MKSKNVKLCFNCVLIAGLFLGQVHSTSWRLAAVQPHGHNKTQEPSGDSQLSDSGTILFRRILSRTMKTVPAFRRLAQTWGSKSENVCLCCENILSHVSPPLYWKYISSSGVPIWIISHFYITYSLQTAFLNKQSRRCLTCACSFPLSRSSAVSPLSPHGGALARPPVIPGAVDRRRREDLPKQAWREERQKK